MRPYLVSIAVILMAAAAFGQMPGPFSGGCIYGCAPFVPRLTTPEISLEQFSPNPVGASNATTGLIAGATNSTLSQIQGSTSSVYTVPVWYQGGSPIIAPSVHLGPEPIGHEMHPMHGEGFREEFAREDRHPREEARKSWSHITTEYAGTPAEIANPEKAARKAGHTYTNDDVNRQNDNNGVVKYRGKTEKI
jgi:hypothetical protein